MKLLTPIWRTVLLILLAIIVATLAPPEKTLGEQARLIYFHGGWVWAALLCFACSGAAGLYGFFRRKANFLSWSIALQRSALIFWLLFLPMSLWVMQVSWNGLFLAEPRFRIPLNFAIIGLVFQVATTLIGNPRVSGMVNFLFVAALAVALRGAEYILHPQMPILNSQAGVLRYIFLALVILLTAACWSLAHLLTQLPRASQRNSLPASQPQR